MKQLLITIAAVVLVGCGPSMSIYEAAGFGNIEAIKQHLAADADLNAKDTIGRTPLHIAAYTGHKEIVELLIANGADLNGKDGHGSTPLHNAAVNGHKEIAELLITKGADVNAKKDVNDPEKDDGGTPLHGAADMGRFEVVELLIAKGADVNERDNFGKTPLHGTTHPDTFFLLRKHGGKRAEELKAEGK